MIEDNLMALSLRDYIIIKAVQSTLHQGNVTYGSIQYSCMSLTSVSLTLFKSPGRWDKVTYIAY